MKTLFANFKKFALKIHVVYCLLGFLIPISCGSLLASTLVDKIEAKSFETCTATFDSYHISRHVLNGSVFNIRINLENGDTLEIIPGAYSTELEQALSSLEKGDTLHFTRNPETQYLTWLKSDTVLYQRDYYKFPLAVLVLLLFLLCLVFVLSLIALALQSIDRQKIREKANQYTYRIGTISEESRWVIVECNEENAKEDTIVFINLLQRISAKLNQGAVQGTMKNVGENRYQIRNDPLSLVYQYDSLFGIVIEYNENVKRDALLKFLSRTANIRIKQ